MIRREILARAAFLRGKTASQAELADVNEFADQILDLLTRERERVRELEAALARSQDDLRKQCEATQRVIDAQRAADQARQDGQNARTHLLDLERERRAAAVRRAWDEGRRDVPALLN
jgi:hypothetical protein